MNVRVRFRKPVILEYVLQYVKRVSYDSKYVYLEFPAHFYFPALYRIAVEEPYLFLSTTKVFKIRKDVLLREFLQMCSKSHIFIYDSLEDMLYKTENEFYEDYE